MRLFVIAVAIAPAIALACIHPPAGYKGEAVSEREKLAFLFHDGQNAHLVLRTVLAAKGGLPETMAWVVPLPSLPSKYEEATAELFEELRELIPRNDPRMEIAKSAPAPAKVAAAKAAPQILVHEKQVVGSYQIQPIEILAESAGGELNAWLAKNGFSEVPAENQKHYLRKGAVFLALRVEGLKGAESELKPLHIIYRNDTLHLPLKFSTHSGEFAVRLYTLTEQAPSRKVLEDFGLRVGGRSYEISKVTLGLRAPLVAKLLGDRAGFITEFRGYGYNASHRVADWKEDPWLAPGGRGPGGEPGGVDSAASWPDFPTVGFRPEPYSSQPRQRTANNWIWSAVFSLPLVIALWWLYRRVRLLAAAWSGRTTSANGLAHLANRTMLLGVAILVLLATGHLAIAAWGLWGSLIDPGASVLGWGGIAAILGGAGLRLAASFRRRSEPRA